MTDLRYVNGYRYATAIVRRFPSRWTRLGLFTYHNGALWDNRDVFLAPEQLLLALAAREQKQGHPTLLFLDANRTHPLRPSRSSGLSAFKRLVDTLGVDIPVFRFGRSGDPAFDALRPARIGLEWLASHPETLAQVVADISPLHLDVDMEALKEDRELGDVERIVKLLRRWLGPPTLTDDIREKFRSAEGEAAREAAGLAAATIAAAANPTLLLYRGAKYAVAFARLLSRRRKKERREMLEQWHRSVEEAYTPESVGELVAEQSTVVNIIAALRRYNLCIILNSTYQTYYDLFITSLLSQIVEEWEPTRTEATIILDGVSYLLKSPLTEDLVLGLPDRRPRWHTACYVHTHDPPEESRLQELIRSLVKETAVIFDVAPEHFDFAFQNLSLSQRAWLMHRFERIAQLHRQRRLGYLIYDRRTSPPWKLQEVGISPRLWLSSRLHDTHRAITTLLAQTQPDEQGSDEIETSIREENMPS